MKSISLTYAELSKILEEHLNAHELRVPHHVVDIDPCDYDARDQMQINIALEPIVAEPTPAQKLLAIASALEAHSNGTNGKSAKNGGGKTPVKKEAAAVPATDDRKRRPPVSDSQREHVITLLRQGENRKRIAQLCDVAVGTVYDIRNAAIASGELDNPGTGAVVA